MIAAPPVGRVLADQNMVEAEVLPFAGGRAAVFSARGPDKDGPNEDSAGLIPIDEESGVLVVADGMGGQPGGANASQIVLDCLTRSLQPPLGEDRPTRGAILDAVELANREIMELGIGAATTFAALEVAGRTLRPYHVGDSAILVVGQRGRIKLQTISHSPVGYALESGLLDEHEAMHHDDRHVVSNMVGANDMRIEVGSHLQLSARDTAMIASDGVFDNLNLQEIVEIVRTKPFSIVCRQLAEICSRRMRKLTNGKPSKPDDYTFVLFRPDPSRSPDRSGS